MGAAPAPAPGLTWVRARGCVPVGACPWLCAGELLGPTLQFHLI